MKVLKFFTHQGRGHDDPVYNLGFEKYQDECPDYYLMLGNVYDAINSGNYNDKKKVVLSLEEPNFCTPGHHVDTFNKVDKVLTICPYTTATIPNRQFVFFPFNQDFVPNQQEKEYDVIYSGSVQSSAVSEMINCMLPHKYVFINFDGDHRANHPKVSYQEKLNLYSKTKVTICHNLLWVSSGNIPRYRAFTNANNNEAFRYLDQGVMPQIKSRVFEAAFSKSLILCGRDYWNVIEYFFEPNKDFIYYDNMNDLREKLNDVTKNYSNYTHIVDNAYTKAINNYTSHQFVERYLK